VNEFLPVCKRAELPADGAAASFEVKGEPVAIVATEGDYFAVRDECSHAAVPLSEGDVDGYTVECWLHGSCFDLRTGAPVNMPATVAVPVYPLKFEGDDVLVSIEES
jgi:3-phenylpropionate/trans-cinnamate dioxygenase ferredoxin subunit